MKNDQDPNKYILDEWFNARDLAENTRINYTQSLTKYSKFAQKTLEELLEEAEDEEEQGIKKRKRKIGKYITGFRSQLQEEGKAPNSIRGHINAVKGFYRNFDIGFPDIKVKTGDISLEDNYGKLLTREDILKLVAAAANPRDRAIIYTMALTGLSQAEVRSITIRKYFEAANVKSFEDLFERENEILSDVLTLNLTRGKVRYRHTTFLPPEANREIIAYFRDRCYGLNPKVFPDDLEGPVFVNVKGKPLSTRNVSEIYYKVGKRAGFTKRPGAYSFWRSHAMRKYFNSVIINTLGDHILADYLSGRKIDRVKRAYWYADPKKLKERYLVALPFLSLDEVKVLDIETEERKKILKELEESENARKKSNAKIKELEIEVQKNKKKTDKMMKVLGNSEFWEDHDK